MKTRNITCNHTSQRLYFGHLSSSCLPPQSIHEDPSSFLKLKIIIFLASLIPLQYIVNVSKYSFLSWVILVIRQVLETLAWLRFQESWRGSGRSGERIYLNVWVKHEYSINTLGTHLTVFALPRCVDWPQRLLLGRSLDDRSWGIDRVYSWLLWWILLDKVNLFASSIWLLEGLLCLADRSSELGRCLVNWESLLRSVSQQCPF